MNVRSGSAWARSRIVTVILAAIMLVVIGLPFFPNSDQIDPIYHVAGDVSNSGIQRLEDVADIHVIGIDNQGSRSGLGSSMGLKDIDGDGIDDLYFGYGLLPGNSGLVAFKGGEEHIKGIVDLEETDPDLSYNIQPSMWLDTGDMDADGDLDLVLGGYHGSGMIYRREGEDLLPVQSIMAGGPDNPLNYQYTDHVIMDDLDNDGRDEVISGYFYNNPNTRTPPPHQVNILWGTGERTTLQRGRSWFFGSSMATGDIDGDGNKDLAIGGYNWYDLDRNMEQTGSVLLFFNISRLKETATFDPREVSDCWIQGSSVEDFFGYSIELKDINRDGKDDIIVGSPGSDDPVTNEYNTGAIHVFYGDVESSFPKNMYSNGGADQIIYGSTGKYEGDPDYNGDKIGRVFEVADIDGDLEYELVVAIPGKHTPGNEMHDGLNAGAVTIHETKDAFPSVGGYVKLRYPSRTFTVEGNDPIDSTGWQVATGDINDDNVSDILISVPGGDGIDNSRVQCGEVFLVLGNALRVEGFKISGEGFLDGVIIPSEGTISLNTTFSHSKGPDLVEETILTLDPEGGSIELIMDKSVCRIQNDPWDSIKIEDFSTGQKGYMGWMKCELSVRLNIPIKGQFDIGIVLREKNGSNITYFVDSPASVSKSLKWGGGPSFFVDGIRSDHENSWIKEEAIVDIKELSILNKAGDIPFRRGDVGIILKNGQGEVIRSTFREGVDLSFASDELKLGVPWIEPVLNDITFPPGYPEEQLPDLPNSFSIDLRLDDAPPLPPSDLLIFGPTGSSPELISPGDVDLLINSTFEEEMDPNGSGLDRFEVSIDSGPFEPVMEAGGLLGVYYKSRRFTDPCFQRIDDEITFDWGKFGPDPNLGIHYNDFSVMWRGWFKSPWDFPFNFRLNGYGMARLEVDGQEIIPWSEISKTRTSTTLNFEKDTIHAIMIQFRNDPVLLDTAIELKWLEEDGRFWPVGSSNLFSPSNRTTIHPEEDQDNIVIHARSVDMVGHISEESNIFGRRDANGPSFDPYNIPQWTATDRPILNIRISDRSSDGGLGIGVDPYSIMYRTVTIGGMETSWTKVRGKDVGSILDVSFIPELSAGFRGSIQMKAMDLFGNSALSQGFPLNVDSDPPKLELQGTGKYLLTGSNDIELTVRIKDPGGSGLDGNTVEARYSKKGYLEWSDWRSFGGGLDGNDVLVSDSLPLIESSYSLEFRAKDLVGNMGTTGEIKVTIEVLVEDLPPIPVIASPKNGSGFRLGEPVYLDATGTTDDGISGSELKISWFSNISGHISSGGKGKVYLEKGFHRITLYVDDGLPGHNTSAFVDIEVYDPSDNTTIDGDDGEDSNSDENGERDLTWMILLVILSVLGVIGGVAFMIIRKRKEEEIMIGFVSRSSDDTNMDKHEENDDH